jgi:hypothetical protein
MNFIIGVFITSVRADWLTLVIASTKGLINLAHKDKMLQKPVLKRLIYWLT